MSKAKLIGVWVITVLLALTFLFAGGTKLAGTPAMAENFVRYGLPAWLLYVTGAIEVGAALLLLVPRTATLGAALLVPTMVGAALAHLKVGEIPQMFSPLVLLVLAVIVGLARRHQVLPPFNRFLAPAGAPPSPRA